MKYLLFVYGNYSEHEFVLKGIAKILGTIACNDVKYQYGDSGEECATAMIISLDDMLSNRLLENALSLATLMGCSFYGISDRKGRAVAYSMDADYEKAFGMIRCGRVQQATRQHDHLTTSVYCSTGRVP